MYVDKFQSNLLDLKKIDSLRVDQTNISIKIADLTRMNEF